jgi:hypothetical protein
VDHEDAELHLAERTVAVEVALSETSSSDMGPRPSSGTLRRRLSKVMRSRDGSMSRRNPLASSRIRPSSPRRSAITGR